MNAPASRRPWPVFFRSVLSRRTLGIVLLAIPLLAAAILLGITVRQPELNEPFFVKSTYYLLFALLLLYFGIRVSALGDLPALRAWLKDNRVGIALTALVSAVVILAVDPAFRVLADEANLVGVSKNLYFQRTADFTVTGKWYFEAFWDLGRTTDRRPALFPFLVSLLHTARGYRPENAFHLNAIVFVLFVFTSYRLAKALGGELFGVAAAILVATNPNTLFTARSAGFDFLATFLLVVIVKGFVDLQRDPSPRRLAAFALELCLFAHVRYEGWALLGVAAVTLLGLRVAKWAHLRGFGFVYCLVPLFMLPRYWQSIAKADDAEQPLSASLFSVSNFQRNLTDYLQLTIRPLDLDGPHSQLLLILGAVGCGLLLLQLPNDWRAKRLSTDALNFAAFVAVLLGLEFAICFSYSWGKPLHAASARLFVWLDTFVALMAAWLLTLLGRRLAVPLQMLGRRSGAPVTLFACGALFAMHVPAASEGRFGNTLIVTRDAAQAWRYFAKLEDRRILIASDRPGFFTIMNYGSVDISGLDKNRSLLVELSRHLYHDIYLIQEIDLETHEPMPGFNVWPDVEKETVEEFQSSASSSMRIARVKQ